MTDVAAGLTPGVMVLLVGAAFLAGLVDAIAGGGGLVTVPALLATGLPASLVLGTNKGQSVFGSAAALVRYARAGLVDRRRAVPAFVLGASGAILGVRLVTALPPGVLRPVVLGLLVVVALSMLLRPKAPSGRRPLRRAGRLAPLFALGMGLYDGFFGPGTGTFLIVGFVLLFGESLREASANAKVVNFASNLASVVLFARAGAVVWTLSLPMAAAQVAGGWTGARLASQLGDALVRRTLVVVSLGLVGKLAWDLVGRSA
ncbi:MAG: hypothetical protein RL199_112 [Pseudomonadota bacterium]